jgi:hypothetical protein
MLTAVYRQYHFSTLSLIMSDHQLAGVLPAGCAARILAVAVGYSKQQFRLNVISDMNVDLPIIGMMLVMLSSNTEGSQESKVRQLQQYRACLPMDARGNYTNIASNTCRLHTSTH